MNLRIAMLALATTAMIGTQTLAADVGPLAAGNPAGVEQAQGTTHLWVILGVSAVIVSAVAIGVAMGYSGSCPASQCPASNSSVSSSSGTSP